MEMWVVRETINKDNKQSKSERKKIYLKMEATSPTGMTEEE